AGGGASKEVGMELAAEPVKLTLQGRHVDMELTRQAKDGEIIDVLNGLDLSTSLAEVLRCRLPTGPAGNAQSGLCKLRCHSPQKLQMRRRGRWPSHAALKM